MEEFVRLPKFPPNHGKIEEVLHEDDIEYNFVDTNGNTWLEYYKTSDEEEREEDDRLYVECELNNGWKWYGIKHENGEKKWYECERRQHCFVRNSNGKFIYSPQFRKSFSCTNCKCKWFVWTRINNKMITSDCPKCGELNYNNINHKFELCGKCQASMMSMTDVIKRAVGGI